MPIRKPGLILLPIILLPAAVAVAGGWVALGPAGATIADIAVASASTVYVASTNGVFKSVDGGSSWILASNGLPTGSVTALALRSAIPTVIYAGLETPAGNETAGAVYKSSDAGANWTLALLLPAPSTVTSLAISNSPGGSVFAGSSIGLFRSTDQGAHWSAAEGVLIDHPIRSVAIDQSSPLTVYAGSEAHGVCRTRDGGDSWDGGFNTYDAVDALEVANDGTAYAATHSLATILGLPPATAIFESSDQGASWQPASHRSTLANGAIVLASASNPQWLYAGTPTGVYRSVDGGANWAAVSDGLTNLSVTALAVGPGSPEIVYAGTAGGGLFRRVFEETGACTAGQTSLCLNGGRFRVEVSWSAENFGTSGAGRAISLTEDTGAFWFFNSSNLELVVKVLDGRTINGRFWVFYGALSNVAYTITVTDTVSERTKTYTNPQGQLASSADTDAF